MRFLGNVLATIIGILFFMLSFFGILLIRAILVVSLSVVVKKTIELNLEDIQND
jgi:uncharacterized membrane protein YgaE (UPF0421/DUF939 family)